MKIVVTGSNGLLGQTLVNLLKKQPEKYQVFGLSRGANRSCRNDFVYHNIDITQKGLLTACLQEIQPDCIVNTAAMTNVDACEEYKEECNRLNITAVESLSEFCKAHGIHLIHISTDFIFDGAQGYYKETDPPNPLSHYGHSKLKSEEVVVNSNISYTILRTILVYGNVPNLGRSNIVLWVREMLKEGKEITIVNDQYRMPTYVEDLAVACQISIDKKVKGIFNISSNTLLTIYEIAQQVAEVFELDQQLIKPISTAQLNQRAARPPKTGFDLSKTNKELQFFSKSFQDDLQRFKETCS